MNKIESYLSSVYNEEEVDFLLSAINEIVDKYQQVSVGLKSITHKDVALITYGDQVQDSRRPHVSVLHDFLNEFGKEIITIVHVLPFYPYTSDDGFSVTDYYQVREDIGGWNEMKSLSTDYRLMYDAVINHMSAESEWFKGYLQGDKEYQNYFIDGSNFGQLEAVVRPRTSPLIHDYEGKKVWTTFSRDQVDLNYANPKLFIQILDVLASYIHQGASLLRLDAIGFMWKEDETTCIHLPQTHSLIKVMREVLDLIQSGTIIITETNVPHEENISYFGKGDEAHMVYNFTLPPLLAHTILTGHTEAFFQWLSTLDFPGKDQCFFNFLASHDGVGLRPVDGILSTDEIKHLADVVEFNGGKVSYRSVGEERKPYELNCNYLSLMYGQENDSEIAIKRFLLAHAVLLTLPGLPAIYYHSLVGSENDIDGLKRLEYNRAINREKHQLQEIRGQLHDQSTRQSRIYNGLREMIEIRGSYSAFHPFTGCEVTKVGEHVLQIIRQDQIDVIHGFFNFGLESFEMENKKDLMNVSTGLKPSHIILNEYSFEWYR